jgi:flagellar biosynthesis component FlhA
MVRKCLNRTITDLYKNEAGKILAITLEPSLEHQIVTNLRQEADGINLALSTDIAMEISKKSAQAWKEAMDKGLDRVVLLCDSRLRSPLAAMLLRTVSLLPVIAYDEIVFGTEVEPIETIAFQQAEMTALGEQGQLAPALAGGAT